MNIPADSVDQPSLFDAPGTTQLNPIDATHLSIQAAFEQFHERNPWVYRHLVQLARDLHRRGRNKIGIGMLFEVLRWEYLRVTVDPDSDFKLNNNYRSRYARLIAARNPDLVDVFETRKLTST